MKKLLALILALAMVFSLVACVAKQEAPAAKEEAPAEKEEALPKRKKPPLKKVEQFLPSSKILHLCSLPIWVRVQRRQPRNLVMIS